MDLAVEERRRGDPPSSRSLASDTSPPNSGSSCLTAPVDASGRWDDQEAGPTIQMHAGGYGPVNQRYSRLVSTFVHDAY